MPPFPIVVRLDVFEHILVEQYDVGISPQLIRSVTDAVMAEIMAWHARPLEPMYR